MVKEKIRFGPAGLGSVKDAEKTLEEYAELGLKACEIPFTYGVYIKKKEDAVRIGKKAENLDITLSIHAPYYINLNSAEKEKIEKSKERILNCCKVGSWLKAKRIVFHPGFYGKMSKKETYDNIKKAIIDINKKIKENNYQIELAPETTGKVNVFGSIEEISSLVKDTKCGFCIDFAHILAREGDYNFGRIFNNDVFSKSKEFHIHFSGIEYGEKGEKKHLRTPEKEIKKLIENIENHNENKKEKKVFTIINESPFPVEDSLNSLKILKKE